MPAGSFSSWNAAFATLVDADAAVGAGDGEAAVLELDVAFRGFQQVRGELLALGDDLVADQDDGAAAHGGRARAARAHAERDGVGVALDELDPVADRRRAGPPGSASGWWRDPGRARSSRSRRSCRRADRSGSRRSRWSGSAACSMVLERPMPRSMPRFAASLRRASKPVQSRERHGAVHVLLEPPAVVGEGERRLVGHRLRRDGVAAAQLGRIDLHLVGGDVDQPLDHVGRLRPAGAAIGRGAMRVGEHAGHRARAAPASCRRRTPCRY